MCLSLYLSLSFFQTRGLTCTTLGHSEDVYDSYCVVVYKLSQHETHDFHRHARSTVLEHLQERQGGDINLFRGIYLWSVRGGSTQVHAQLATKQPLKPFRHTALRFLRACVLVLVFVSFHFDSASLFLSIPLE